MKRPYVLTIAGHDPSGGAGLNADIKTFEANEVMGLSVVTGITVQNDADFEEVQWLSFQWIEKQIRILFKMYEINVAKIGILENMDMLSKLIQLLLQCNPDIKIIWDPIIKSSSGFLLNKVEQIDKQILQSLYLITPNKPEYEWLQEKGFDFNECNYLLKGGHDEENRGTDSLFQDGKSVRIDGESFKGKSKHGTGCVLSAAIASNLAKEDSLHEACTKAKRYVEAFILSNDDNLGYHQAPLKH